MGGVSGSDTSGVAARSGSGVRADSALLRVRVQLSCPVLAAWVSCCFVPPAGCLGVRTGYGGVARLARCFEGGCGWRLSAVCRAVASALSDDGPEWWGEGRYASVGGGVDSVDTRLPVCPSSLLKSAIEATLVDRSPVVVNAGLLVGSAEFLGARIMAVDADCDRRRCVVASGRILHGHVRDTVGCMLSRLALQHGFDPEEVVALVDACPGVTAEACFYAAVQALCDASSRISYAHMEWLGENTPTEDEAKAYAASLDSCCARARACGDWYMRVLHDVAHRSLSGRSPRVRWAILDAFYACSLAVDGGAEALRRASDAFASSDASAKAEQASDLLSDDALAFLLFACPVSLCAWSGAVRCDPGALWRGCVRVGQPGDGVVELRKDVVATAFDVCLRAHDLLAEAGSLREAPVVRVSIPEGAPKSLVRAFEDVGEALFCVFSGVKPRQDLDARVVRSMKAARELLDDDLFAVCHDFVANAFPPVGRDAPAEPMLRGGEKVRRATDARALCVLTSSWCERVMNLLSMGRIDLASCVLAVDSMLGHDQNDWEVDPSIVKRADRTRAVDVREARRLGEGVSLDGDVDVVEPKHLFQLFVAVLRNVARPASPMSSPLGSSRPRSFDRVSVVVQPRLSDVVSRCDPKDCHVVLLDPCPSQVRSLGGFVGMGGNVTCVVRGHDARVASACAKEIGARSVMETGMAGDANLGGLSRSSAEQLCGAISLSAFEMASREAVGSPWTVVTTRSVAVPRVRAFLGRPDSLRRARVETAEHAEMERAGVVYRRSLGRVGRLGRGGFDAPSLAGSLAARSVSGSSTAAGMLFRHAEEAHVRVLSSVFRAAHPGVEAGFADRVCDVVANSGRSAVATALVSGTLMSCSLGTGETRGGGCGVVVGGEEVQIRDSGVRIWVSPSGTLRVGEVTGCVVVCFQVVDGVVFSSVREGGVVLAAPKGCTRVCVAWDRTRDEGAVRRAASGMLCRERRAPHFACESRVAGVDGLCVDLLV